MNTETQAMTTDFTNVKDSAALRRVLLAVLAPLLALLAVLAMAGQSQAASYGYAARVNINSYYGAASGDASTNASRTSFYVGAHIKDVRTDGYCATVQMRALTQTSSGTAASAWINVGFNCSTTSWKFVSQVRYTTGWKVDQIQIRACQGDRYGNVVATCSAPVNATNWHVV